jgi:ribosome-binding factor A
MAKTAYTRATRVADQIRMEVADIIMRKTKDPRVASVTVTDVAITNDLRLARVFVTTLLDAEHERLALAGLDKAKGFIRSELGHRLNLRYTPEIVFQKDVSGMRGDRLLSILDHLDEERQKEPKPDESATPAKAGEDQ